MIIPSFDSLQILRFQKTKMFLHSLQSSTIPLPYSSSLPHFQSNLSSFLIFSLIFIFPFLNIAPNHLEIINTICQGSSSGVNCKVFHTRKKKSNYLCFLLLSIHLISTKFINFSLSISLLAYQIVQTNKTC